MDMKWASAVCVGDGANHRQAVDAVEQVIADDQRGAAAPLFMPRLRIKVHINNITLFKHSYTKQAEDIRESVRVLKEKLTEVLENRSERNRWISQFTQFSTLETLDRRALIYMVQSIRVRGKKELDITFTHEDEYKKALQLLALAAQQKDYEQRKVG